MINILEKIDEWAVKTPQAICFQDQEHAYTFLELKEQSDTLAHYLDEHYQNTLPVIVYGGLDFRMLVAFLAATKSGHAYIPLDVDTPDDRIEMITQVADFTAVIALSDWPSISIAEPIITESLFDGLTKEPKTYQLTHEVKEEENFYIIFTSGTTGVPKGVQISHDNLVSYTDWMLTDFNLKEQATYLSQAPYSFDLSVMNLYPSLLTGGKLVPLSKAMVQDFQALFENLPKMKLNVWVSTPSFVDICLMEPRFNGEVLSDLQTFLFCGEELTVQTAQALLERFPTADIYNTYGPTETTVAVTEINITPEVLAKYDRLPVGYAKKDTTLYIVDEKGQILSEGESGEIVIAGPSVSKGYLNNPEKTAQAFLEIEGQPAYKTGDQGIMKEHLLFYQGRIDFQVKLHGYRIELEDIDHHLMNVSYVSKGIVVPKYHQHKVVQLIAFVVPKDRETFAKDYQLTKAIKAELKEVVMDYMVPQKFVYVDSLPQTFNGKIDRKSLIHEVNAT